jgi:hypothetical protein
MGLAHEQLGQHQDLSSTAVLLLVRWAGSAAGFWPGNQLHIPHLVPGFAFGISQPEDGVAVWPVLGDDQDRCTRPADPPKLLTICQHDQIAGGGVLEVWGHRSRVETQGCSTGHMRSGGDYLSGIRRLSCGFPQDT